jgi:hypothetical protein
MTPTPPQQMMSPNQGMPPAGISPGASQPQNIPEPIRSLLKQSVSGFCTSTIRPTVETDKVTWNARIRRNELYYRGLQYLSYTPGGQAGLVDYQPIASGQPLNLTNESEGSTLYDYVLNVLQGDVDTFVAVLGARSPNTQAQARDLSNEAQIRLKMKADRVNAYLDSSWNVAELHPQLVRGLALYGTMFSYVRYTINPRKWGITPMQQYSVQNVPAGSPYYQCWRCGTETQMDQAHSLTPPGFPPNRVPCSKCGNPLGPDSLVQPESIPSLVPSDIIPFANGACEIDILNPAHVTAPVYLKDVDNLPWLIKESEEDKGALVEAYPELRDKIYSDQYYIDPSAASAAGRWTRDLLTSPSGYLTPKTKGRWLHTLIWLAPTCYEYLPNDRTGRLRDWLLQTFPDGMKVPMVNGDVMIGKGMPGSQDYAPSRIVNERLTSVWAACKPKPMEMLYADPYFDCMIQGQDCINDSVSMIIEQAERSNPFVIADPEVLSPDMLRQYSSIPGEFKFAKPGSVGSLDKGFFRVPAAELNPVLINFIDKYISWCREITGITPAIFGGADGGGQKTARQYEIMRNQALMKLNTPWGECRRFWAQTKENGIYQVAKYSGGRLHSTSRQGTTETMQVEGIWELMQGGFYMECEESMPSTIGQRKDFFMNALTMPPEAQGMIGLHEPDNLVLLQEAVGLSDWDTPGYKEVIRLYDIIGQLKGSQPQPGQPGPPDPMTGQPGPPGPPQPSIPFDPFLFEFDLAIKVVKSWLLSDAGEAARISNPNGYQNVMAFGHSIMDQMPPQFPPAPPPKATISINFSDLTPDAQQAVFQNEHIMVPNMQPGQPLAIPKPPPVPGGGGVHGGAAFAPSDPMGLSGPPPGDLNAPPPGGGPPPLTGGPPPGALSAPPPGALQGPIGVQ